MPTQQEQGLEHVTLTTACQKLARECSLIRPLDESRLRESIRIGSQSLKFAIAGMELLLRILSTLAAGLCFSTFSTTTASTGTPKTCKEFTQQWV